MTRTTRTDHDGALWDLAEPLLGSGRLVEGTLMGRRCLRSASGGFVATVERAGGRLVVKLPRARVEELIGGGLGSPFAPNGKVFREWLAVDGDDESTWMRLVEESIDWAEGTDDDDR